MTDHDIIGYLLVFMLGIIAGLLLAVALVRRDGRP